VRIAAFIPTRDGQPNFHVASRLSKACSRVGATWGHTASHLSACTSRNQAVAMAYGAGATHLFMCDNDTHIPEDAIERLVSLGVPIATGCTPTTFRSSAGHTPCINIADESVNGQPLFYRHWFNGIREVQWCGASCILIHMDVFERVGFPWWNMDQDWDGTRYMCWSEDLTFCRKAHQWGIPIIADGDIRCLHDRHVECSAFISEESNVYGSHIPVLKNIASSVHVRSAVEYGPGMHSTSTLLNRDTFPELTSLIAFESSEVWHKRIAAAFCDSRLSLQLQSLDDFAAVRGSDIVLIDSGDRDYSVRSRLVTAYENDEQAVVVLHDAEEPILSDAVNKSRFAYKHVFGTHPKTAVLSNIAWESA